MFVICWKRPLKTTQWQVSSIADVVGSYSGVISWKHVGNGIEFMTVTYHLFVLSSNIGGFRRSRSPINRKWLLWSDLAGQIVNICLHSSQVQAWRGKLFASQPHAPAPDASALIELSVNTRVHEFWRVFLQRIPHTVIGRMSWAQPMGQTGCRRYTVICLMRWHILAMLW